MKRSLLSILMAATGLFAFSQSQRKLINWTPAYPLAIGERTVGDYLFANGSLYMFDIELDSLPRYEIGQIFEQTVRYTEDGYGFYVKADSLHSSDVTYSFEVNNPPKGSIHLNEASGRFKYYPAIDDFQPFRVTFTATNGTERISEDVLFCPMPRAKSETTVFYSKGTMPDAGDYITIAESETSSSIYLNAQERPVYSISISGKDVVFDNAVQNKVLGLSGREDVCELNIYAERLIIRSALRFPKTYISIHAKELIFEDKGNNVASINTTPMSIETMADGIGMRGEDAGNIDLYIKEFKANRGIRFILNGGRGQSTNRNGTPGNGGNGGVVLSTIDVSSYCDFSRGSGGVKYDVASDGSANLGPIIGNGAIGASGHILLVSNPFAYLHPYYVDAVIRHANDAFINNHTEFTYKTCNEYRQLIDEYLKSGYIGNGGGSDEGVHDTGRSLFQAGIKREVNDFGEGKDEQIDLQCEFQNDLMEIYAMLFKLEQGIDYFGNPAGWVPLLSFEVYLKNYDNEINRAMPTLYLSNWMKRIDCSLQDRIKGSQEAASQTKKEIDNNKAFLNSLVSEIPSLQDEAAEVNRMIVELTDSIETLQNALMAEAIKKVKKRNRLKKILGIAKSVIGVIPTVGSIGTALNVASNIADAVGIVSNIFTPEYDVTPYTSVLEDVGSVDYKKMISSVQDVVDKTKFENIGSDAHLLKDTYESLSTAISPLTKSITNVCNILKQNTAPNAEVQAEYNRLLACSTEYQRMKARIDELNVRKINLTNRMNEVFSDMTATLSELSNDALALDAFRRDAFTVNSKRDLNAMLYLARMEQRAKNLLLKYDYYLRKAYEYRLLKPYEGEEFNLTSMFERFEALGMSTESAPDRQAYDALASVFRERISDMTHRIVEEYTYNQSEKSPEEPISIAISHEQLDVINANGSVTLNLYEMGNGINFFQDEENIRIRNLGVRYIKAHAIGDATKSRLALDLKHSGMSQYRRNGKIYWYNHMSRDTDNPHFWRTTIDFADVVEKEHLGMHQNSVAISSLLSSILNNNAENVMLFSRPSVWSDITMTRQMQTNGEDIVIDSLVLELQYDYTLRADNIRNIDVTANNGLMPYFACSVEDIGGNSSGIGPLYRSYRASSQPVTFTAQEKYETYYFLNWTDRKGNVVSDKPELTVSRSTDQYYIANYERRLPKMEIPDTIKVDAEAGIHSVHIKNIGTDDVEMDWYVKSGSSNSWIHLGDDVEGIDEGDFSFTYDANFGASRIDSLVVSAPETGEAPKKIYIVQDPNPNSIIVEKVVNANKIEAIYTPDGKIITSMQRGINIIQMKDGTVKRILVE